MCIGIPMQVLESGFGYALCEGMGQQRQVDTLLVGDIPVGSWVLVFLNSAREVLEEDEAKKITAAVSALNHVMENPIASHVQDDSLINHLFADLVDREPPKPDSLLALEAEQAKNKENNNGH